MPRPFGPRPPAAANAMFYQRAGKIAREAEFIVQSFPHAEMTAVMRIRRQLIAVWEILDRMQDPLNTPAAKDAMKDVVQVLNTHLYEFEMAPPPPLNAGVKRIRTGRPGQPRYDLNIDDILFQRGIGARFIDIARAMGVTSKTIQNHLRRSGITSDVLVTTDISDIHLDHIVNGFVYMHPFTGVTMIKGFLLSLGINVPRKRVNESLRRIDPIGTLIRSVDSLRLASFFHSLLKQVVIINSPTSLQSARRKRIMAYGRQRKAPRLRILYPRRDRRPLEANRLARMSLEQELCNR